MAETDTLKSVDTENPKKTLTPNLSNELKMAIVSSVEETDKNDTKVTDTSIVSPPTDDDTQKKFRRAERFGVPVQLSEQEKRSSRAERFGTTTGTVTASGVSKKAEEQKRKARAERFGLPVPSDDEAKKKARLTRFGSDTKVNAQEEEKRKARATRFSDPPSNVSDINHEEDVDQKTAITGNTTGGA